MSEGINRVFLVGNLCKDPEFRQGKGDGVLKLRLATGESYKDRDGAWKQRTEYHNVTVFGKRGEALSRFLTNGAQVTIEGSLRTSSYDKDGEKRYTTEVIASNVILPSGKSRSNDAEQADPADDFSGSY